MSHGRFAERTDVSPEKSRLEVERTLLRYGATAFGYAQEGDRVMIGFKIKSRTIRMMIPLPHKGASSQTKHDAALRQRWRATALVIKAKLEAVASQIRTVEAEFLNDLVMPDGLTIGEKLMPQIEEAYKDGKLPPLLPGPIQ